MLTRRNALKKLASIPILSFLGIKGIMATPLIDNGDIESLKYKNKRDYFDELGVRTFINAAGTYTALTASLMPQEVMDSINYASSRYVSLDDLQEKAGARIATMLHCEDALVSSGAFSAIMYATAACMTGKDEDKIKQIPDDLRGIKNEVIMQKAHRFGYDRAVRNCGGKIIEVETAQDLENAINAKTAMMFFFNDANARGKITDEEFVKIGKKYGIPTFNDCAADVPPVENLWKYTKMGFDLVAFSGGKGIKGPQSAGLLLGKKDLIEAARLHMPPRANLGRGMKVNKEEVLAMMVALELFVERNHKNQWKVWENQIGLIRDALKDIDGISTKVYVPEIANHVPSLQIIFGGGILHSPTEIKEALRNGSPSIEIASASKDSLYLTTWMMNEDEDKIVARRLAEELKRSS